MDFYLIKGVFDIRKFNREEEKPNYSTIRSPGPETKIINANSFRVNFEEVEKSEKCRKICSTVTKAVGMGNLIHELNFRVSVVEEENLGSVKIVNRSYSNLEDWLDGACLCGPGKTTLLERLCAVFGQQNVKFHLSIRLAYMPTESTVVGEKSLITLWSDGLKLLPLTNKSAQMSGVFMIPPDIWQLWDHGSGYLYFLVTFKIRLNENAIQITKLMTATENVLNVERKLMEDGICTDLEIVDRDGKVVLKCHRAFLAGRSSVFRAMFENKETKEAKEGRLVLGDMGEESVKAMLRWVYSDEIGNGIVENFQVVLELLEAGHKWDLKGLVEEMRGILMGRCKIDVKKWWTVGNALKLYLFAKNVEEMKAIRDKAAGILKCYTMDFGDKLLKSVEYQELFRNDPQTAIELTTLYLNLAECS